MKRESPSTLENTRHRLSRRRSASGAGLAAFGLTLCTIGCVAGNETGDAARKAGSDSPRPDSSVERRAHEVTVPSGTVLAVRFDRELSSASAQAGDEFTAQVAESVRLDGRLVVPAGSEVRGRVVEAVGSKKIGGTARLNLEFDSLATPSGDEAPLRASFVAKGKSQTGKDAATIGGATAGGALIGRMIGHNNDHEADGTSIGAVVGAAVGTAIAASNRGQEVVIPSGTILDIQLIAPTRVRSAS